MAGSTEKIRSQRQARRKSGLHLSHSHRFFAAGSLTRSPGRRAKRSCPQPSTSFGERGVGSLNELLGRPALVVAFELAENVQPATKPIEKYSNVPMSPADACLVHRTETLADPVILTTDEDFHVYRRHGRQVVPCITPKRIVPSRNLRVGKLCAGENGGGNSVVRGVFDGQLACGDCHRRLPEHSFQAS